MKKILFLIGVIFMSYTVSATPIKLMVFGDSLSVGHKLKPEESFWAQLQVALNKAKYSVDVINYSKSGETTGGALKRMKEILAQKPDAVILQFGSNDTFQKVPVEKTMQNLQKIIDLFSEQEIPVLLVGMEVSLTESKEYREAVRKMYTDLAIENELLLYPFFMEGLWRPDGGHVSEDYFLSDGIHPSGKGVSVMVRHIMPVVKQFLAEDLGVQK